MHAKQLGGCWLAALLSVVGLGASAGDDGRLLQAIKAADQVAARALLRQRVDVNAADVDGTTALHWAVHRDDLDIVDRLIRAGAHVTAANRYGVAPLSVACINGNPAIVEKLLKAGADPNTAMPEGETALMTCARTGNADAVKLLLVHGANVNAKETFRLQTALMWAVAQDHPLAAQALIESGADLHARSQGGFTPLLFAARAGHIEAVRILVTAGANVNDALPACIKRFNLRAMGGRTCKDQSSETALHLAILNGHYELAAVLLDKGANPNLSPMGYTALHALVWMRTPDPVNLGNMMPDPVKIDNLDSLDLAEALLAHGADVNARLDRQPRKFSLISLVGATPLFLAAKAADAAYMRLLVANGADPRLTTDKHTTLLTVAAGAGFAQGNNAPGAKGAALEAAKLAFDLTPDNLDVTDDYGDTPMHGAANRGAADTIQFLFDKGAKVDVANKKGWTPALMAEGSNLGAGTIRANPEAYKLLLKLGAAPVQHYETTDFSVLAKKDSALRTELYEPVALPPSSTATFSFTTPPGK